MYANTLFLCGKLAETEWREHPENEESIKGAQARYEQALALFAERHDTAAVARVSRQLAQLLEDGGEPELALVHWKRIFPTSAIFP